MKQLTALTMAFLLVFASCQKPEDLTPGKDISYTQADFVDNEAMVPGAEKAGNRKSDLKVVIRKVNNAENTYRLVLKVDSVALNSVVPTDNPIFQPISGQDNIVFAGLSVPDPKNPDVAQPIVIKGQLVFRRQSENGYFVYVSDPFFSTVNFDYELVGVDYSLRAPNNGVPIEISEKRNYFILPSGKSVEQAPKIATIKVPGQIGCPVINRLRVTTYDDPMGEIAQVVFKGEIAGKSKSTKKDTVAPVIANLVEVDVNRSIGVSNWTNDGCISFFDAATDRWRCLSEITTVLDNVGNVNGTFYLLYANGDLSLTYKADNLVCGTTDHL